MGRGGGGGGTFAPEWAYTPNFTVYLKTAYFVHLESSLFDSVSQTLCMRYESFF